MKYICIYIIVLITLVCKSQNLVPNPSFESYTICPSNGGQIGYAAPWTAATSDISSTDYYNSCSSVMGIPYHSVGFQYPRSGNAYAGLIFYTGTGAREYLQVQLSNPLTQNKIYNIEFYINLYNSSSSCNNISANLSNTRPVSISTYSLQSLTPHIMNLGNPIINDTLNWVKVSGCYTAQGGEEYLTIGNFFDNINTAVTGTTGIAYYNIDDVSVVEITGTCVTGIKEMSYESGIMRVYPNPNNGTFSIAYNFEESLNTFVLFDLMGRNVAEKTLNGNDGVENINLQTLENGVYFYKVTNTTGKLLFTGKIIVGK